MASKLPIDFRKSAEIQTNIDFLDVFTGIGYVKVYPATGKFGASEDQYYLTTNSEIRSFRDNKHLTGTAVNEDFDLDVEKTFTILEKDAIVNYRQFVQSGQSQRVGWTIQHVDSAGTVTKLGDLSGANVTGSAGNTQFYNSINVSLSKKTFKKGEKLRITIRTFGGANSYVSCDPSGSETATEGNVTYTDDSWVLLPIEVPD